MQGLLKVDAVNWEDRPVWYDVWEAFPPKVAPKYEREIPAVHVRKILYPEDIVRAKYYDTYHNLDLVNMKSHQQSDCQRFVDKYIENQRVGITEDDLLKEVEELLRKDGLKYIRLTEQKPVKVFKDVEDEKVDVIESTEKNTELSQNDIDEEKT